MKKVEILVLEKDLRRVTAALGDLGAVQLAQSVLTPADAGAPARSAPSVEEQEIRSDFERAAALARAFGVEPQAEVAPDLPASVEQARRYLVKLRETAESLTDRLRAIEQERTTLQRLEHEMENFEMLDIPAERIDEFSFLHFAIGSLPEERLAEVRKELDESTVLMPFRTASGEERVIGISDKKGRWALEGALSKAGFKPAAVPEGQKGFPHDILHGARQRLAHLQSEHSAVQARLREVALRERQRLLAVWNRLRIELRLIEAETLFAHTASAGVIAGWVPADRLNDLRRQVEAASQVRCIIEVHEALEQSDPSEVPVLLRHSWFIRPFEILVTAYGVPRYGQLEPTLVVAITFLGMFGMMFGDLGQGLVLSLAGFALWRWSRAERWRGIGVILVFAGLSGAFFGVLYGEFFGAQVSWLPSPGWEPLATPDRFLMISLAIGVGMISVALVLNFINSFLRRDYAALLLDRYGVVGAVFYWGTLGLAVRYVVSRRVSAWQVIALVGLPLVLLFVREPILHLLTRRRPHAEPSKERSSEGLFARVAESFMEVYETVAGYLANTVSFLRVGAFAMAHAGLCVAIFETEKVVRTLPAGLAWSVIVVAGGNALAIALEGLVAAVQCVRLQYYEFFGKFFRETGKQFVPFDLRR